MEKLFGSKKSDAGKSTKQSDLVSVRYRTVAMGSKGWEGATVESQQSKKFGWEVNKKVTFDSQNSYDATKAKSKKKA